MEQTSRPLSPIAGEPLLQPQGLDQQGIDQSISCAQQALTQWIQVPVEERIIKCQRFIDGLAHHTQAIAQGITFEMGRPLAHSENELKAVLERSRYMLSIAQDTLGDYYPYDHKMRWIHREALGIYLVIAPWNYPYLTAMNGILPALIAGNTVLLKHSQQTPSCPDFLTQAAQYADFIPGVFQSVCMDHSQTLTLISQGKVHGISFTGSVEGGRKVERAAQGLFIPTNFELGGVDPAYVRTDAPLTHTINHLVEGAFYNAGQSCCAVEHILCHKEIYSKFVPKFLEQCAQLKLGDPRDPTTTLGPVSQIKQADRLHNLVAQKCAQGLQCVELTQKTMDYPTYISPKVLLNPSQIRDIWTEEFFGPIVTLTPVESDDEAVNWINESPFGLSASIWSRDIQKATQLGHRIQTGTMFINRCDYLDPGLAWSGTKQSGKGCALSYLGYHQVTRPKSFNVNTKF